MRIIAAILILGLIIGCATTSRRWDPTSAVADAERDIAASHIRFAYIGGFVPVAAGLPITDATSTVLRRYARLEVGSQGCLRDEHASERAEYARLYNLRMWSHVANQP